MSNCYNSYMVNNNKQHPQTSTIYLDTEVSADGARLAVLGVGLAQHDTAGLDGAKSLPHHGDNGGGVHVLHQSRVERPKYYCFFYVSNNTKDGSDIRPALSFTLKLL